MDTSNESEIQKFRIEYENSGLTKAEFARQKGIEYWKANYALRKALEHKKGKSKSAIKFTKVVSKPIVTDSKTLVITTSYGAQINIPL